MHPPLRLSLLGTLALAWALVVVLTSCSTEVRRADPDADPRAPGKVTLAGCRALLSDEVLAQLAWDRDGEPTFDEFGCEQQAGQGDLRVRRTPVGAGSADDLPAAAAQAFDDRCAELGGAETGQAGEVVDWMGEDIPACVAGGEEKVGSTVLLVLWPERSLLVEARAYALDPTAPELVRSAVKTLARSAERQW